MKIKGYYPDALSLVLNISIHLILIKERNRIINKVWIVMASIVSFFVHISFQLGQQSFH